VLETAQIKANTECVFEEEDIFTYQAGQMTVSGYYHPNMVSPPIEEGGWLYMKLLNGDDISRGAYVYSLKGNVRVQRDVFLNWYNNATFDADGNPLCSGYSGSPSTGPTGNSTYNFPEPTDPEFEGMGAVDPYRGNGIDISSYVNDQNNLMINADYQNLVQIAAPGQATTIFNKGVKVDGDVIAPRARGLIFQGQRMIWSPPIKGNHIYYYR
jgi:hypothetical protein